MGVVDSLYATLLPGSTRPSWWTVLLIWIVTFASFSLLLRNHLFPWLLARLSKHMRVRSVSLWSIRGLYLRTGTQIYRVDRISYGWSNGFNVKLRGLNVEVARPEPRVPVTPTRRHLRQLTLADLSPSPLAHRAASRLYALLEPYFRPLVRTLVVQGLRTLIRWLPQIISKLSFELLATSLTAPELPGTINVEKISLHADLSFTHLEEAIGLASVDKAPRQSRLRRSYSVSAWKRRFTNSFQRTLDRAWGQTQGTASVTFTLRNVAASTGTESPPEGEFFRLPGAINFRASMGFDPREATMKRHSLKVDLDIGDCFVVLDSIGTLLRNLKQFRPERSQQPAFRFPEIPGASPSPSMLSLASSVLPPATPGSGFFSPTSSVIMSPPIDSPPISPTEPDGYISPSSPFFETLSASFRTRRRPVFRARHLKYSKDKSLLPILGHVSVRISAVTFSAPLLAGRGHYKGVIRGVAFSSSLSNDPSQNHLHQRWLGKGVRTDSCDADAYGASFAIQQISVERNTSLQSLRILTLGEVILQALGTQWPVPLLCSSPFMSGDPNAAFVALSASIEGSEITEHIEYLRQLVAHLAIPKPPRNSEPPTPIPESFKLPRIAFDFRHGPIRARLVSALEGAEPLVLELRNNGFVVSVNSHFRPVQSKDPGKNTGTDSGRQFVEMAYNLATAFEPTHVKVRLKATMDTYGFATSSSMDPAFLIDPSILSVDTFEIHGEGHALAFLTSETENVASVISSSPILDLHLSTAAFSVELWHPKIMTALHQMLTLIPPPSQEVRRTVPLQTPLLDKMPAGISVTFGIGRLVLLVTSPDLNPREALGLSRGFSCRTTLSMQYSSMYSGHTHRFPNHLHRTQTRQRLHLPQELLVDAISAARASVITHNASAHFRITLTDTVVRSAVTTQYDVASRVILEGGPLGGGEGELLRIPTVVVTVCFTGKRGSVPSKSSDGCEIFGIVPDIRATVRLAYIYDILLAIQLFKSLFPQSSTPARTNASSRSSPNWLVFRFKASITTAQVLCKLPTQMVTLRVDGIDVQNASDGLTLRIGRGLGWVQLPSRINKWDRDYGRKWEELLHFQMLNISLPSTPGIITVNLDADSARLRIPFGYVFADLVTDLSVTVKAVKHLVHITAAQMYVPMPIPEAEGPKNVPHLNIQIRCLSFEAADDSFESKLAVIWRCGLEAVKQRHEREAAFAAKVAAIESQSPLRESSAQDQDYEFTAKHSVPIEEARRRLDEVHELDWTLRLRNLRQQRADSEDAIRRFLHSKHAVKGASMIPNIVEVTPIAPSPPLFRVLFRGLALRVTPPSFPIEFLPDFLHQQGKGLPRDTQFSLLVPLNLHFTLTALHATLRDYPLPLLSIPSQTDSKLPTFTFKADLVIAEEMGSDLSVDWIECLIVGKDHGISGASPLSISVPKTIMPVKSYADANLQVTSSAATLLSWGVSFTPAVQDLVKVIETLSSPPKDSSPGIGFWDKMRLIFHWTLTASFEGEVRLHMKGSRDPYKLSDDGAGFALSWQKNVRLLVGARNDDGELIQITSDSMFIAIPNFEHLYPRNQRPSFARRIPDTTKPFRKICAKLRSGIRFGVGFVLERSCGLECYNCVGSAFHRKCRYFDFRPHYDVRLEKKAKLPVIKGRDDSFNRFRSDFIHLSISLVSSVVDSSRGREPSSMHLTPRVFAHFWAWSALFDSAFSLPTRQGSYYPPRVISPKLGRHLATLKYRIQIYRLYLMHAYIHESRETWVDGVIPWVGVKGMIDELHVDMHQREEEIMVPATMKVTRRKPLYAAEVALKGLDLRALLATFKEPLRKSIEMAAPPQRSNYRAHQNLPVTNPSSPWFDQDDFVETDWSPPAEPQLHLLPIMTCPQFTYFKRNSALSDTSAASKFGLEHSHTCLLGTQQSVPQVQMSVVSARVVELKRMIRNKRFTSDGGQARAALEEMVTLLEDYISLLQEIDNASVGTGEKPSTNYLMPSFTVSPDEWAEFENVYQIHCPTIYMNIVIRDIMMQYYYCSQARKGLEYRMATRAIKFIRDQAELALDDDIEFDNDLDTSWDAPAQIAASALPSALRRMLRGDTSKHSVEVQQEPDLRPPDDFDPLDGWPEGVSLRKSHCCLLLKPQVVLRGESTKDTLIVAALQAKLQVYGIMDEMNADDPVSGKVMSRTLTSVSGLQVFAPVGSPSGDVSIPLEVLLDLRYGSEDFDCLVPQTDATFQYDKFNRLRLRNSVTSTIKTSSGNDNHLQDQTDLIRVHIPRFTVSANDVNFQAISHIVTNLVLFSDAAHRTRLDKLQTLLFTYDFTDLASAANVVAGLQHSLNDAIESQQIAVNNQSPRLQGEEGRLELLKLTAHIFLLSEELNYVFDAIKLAQDRFDDHTDQKSALLLHASSTEISWRMLDDRKDLLSKLVVQNINFFWLSRQDSTTCNNLTVGNLQAFDGSRSATWTEILCKHDDPPNHPLLKRNLFLLASWTVLAPVGGITIYESFELSLHPMRLQIDARVGRRIMEYLWPARRNRQEITDNAPELTVTSPKSPGRTSLDSPRALHNIRSPVHSSAPGLAPPALRKLGTSRSFTDLREAAKETLKMPAIHKLPSMESLNRVSMSADAGETIQRPKDDADKRAGDAAEMKNRASQKSFVLVRISSIHLLLSIAAERSFECRDARIRTRDLEYRNQTLSFEELVNQFIPTDTSWKGWVKMAFHQPLLPVLPVARELFSKTKLIASTRTGTQIDAKGPPPKLNRARALSTDDDSKLSVSTRGWRKTGKKKPETAAGPVTALPLTDEPETFDLEPERPQRPTGRKRLQSFFGRTGSKMDPS